ncbi:hypothetical protein TNCV_2708111 [Trichonephila clavipes]|nr:hypothetical protein TNCV_2708111 [Trichonephila clavipes]
MGKFRGPTVSSEHLNAEDDDNVFTAPIMTDKEILEFVQTSKTIIDSAPVPTSSEMRNIMKSVFRSLEEHSNGEMNSKMVDSKQFVDNMMLKRQCKEKYTAGHRKCNTKKKKKKKERQEIHNKIYFVDNMLTKYQMIKFIDFC